MLQFGLDLSVGWIVKVLEELGNAAFMGNFCPSAEGVVVLCC